MKSLTLYLLTGLAVKLGCCPAVVLGSSFPCGLSIEKEQPKVDETKECEGVFPCDVYIRGKILYSMTCNVTAKPTGFAEYICNGVCPDGHTPFHAWCFGDPRHWMIPLEKKCKSGHQSAGHCPDGQAPLIGAYCGLGGSSCPKRYYCNVAPDDAYAECCRVQSNDITDDAAEFAAFETTSRATPTAGYGRSEPEDHFGSRGVLFTVVLAITMAVIMLCICGLALRVSRNRRLQRQHTPGSPTMMYSVTLPCGPGHALRDTINNYMLQNSQPGTTDLEPSMAVVKPPSYDEVTRDNHDDDTEKPPPYSEVAEPRNKF